ncbi:MAG: hypothetical protein M1834_003359 [Cirrosporium novae-zelandiae]|nr:MAG: hypothetical protein M1834_003359 [Cirrosporium novae-zelandiae]
MSSATDIITYIGVPLAVLGVLPILLTTVRTLTLATQIRRLLSQNHLPASTSPIRPLLLSSLAEVTLPLHALAPLPRTHPEYWLLGREYSALPGGSYTIFHWRMLTTGRRLYRLQYADELRQPAAEVDFEALITFLLDRGAIPDARGWSVLRQSGLWAPTGTRLLNSESGQGVLVVVAPEDSEGVVAVKVDWQVDWGVGRGVGSLPPFWMCVGQMIGAGGKEGAGYELLRKAESARKAASDGDEDIGRTTRFHVENGREIERIHLEKKGMQTELQLMLPGGSANMWFSCAATAVREDTGLWGYSIPRAIKDFARRDTIPCGVMCILGVIDEADTPPWATTYDDQEDRQRNFNNFIKRNDEMRMENQLPAEQREVFKKGREMRELREFAEESKRRNLVRQEREERRILEALNSPRQATKVVAEANLKWLVDKGEVPSHLTMKDVGEAILYLMAVDRDECFRISDILDKWQDWSLSGGMRKEHLSLLREAQNTFAYASIILFLIKDTSTTEGRIAVDIQECIKSWKMVRLG